MNGRELEVNRGAYLVVGKIRFLHHLLEER